MASPPEPARTRRHPRLRKAGVTAAALLASLAAAEALLRATGIVASWSERNGGSYRSPFEGQISAPFLLTSGEPGSVLSFGQTEFDFEIRLNRHGVRDVDHPPPGAEGSDELRLLFLGDSFTMGQGAAFEDSYPQQLAALLSRASLPRPVRVLQAGVSGSDPVFASELLRRSLLEEEPDWVFLVVNGSDIDDIVARGGFERFDDAGRLRPVRDPWWEEAFARSHLVRAVAMKIFGFNWFLLRPRAMLEAEERARETVFEAARTIAALGERHGFRLVVVSHPFVYEVRDRRPPWVSKLAPIYGRLRAAGIPVVDLYDFFRAEIDPDEIERYFWPLDQHCTAAGYRVFARGILAGLAEVEAFPGSVVLAGAAPAARSRD